MDEISMEKALEGYNTIRKYCGQYKNCKGCLFQMDDSDDVVVDACLFSYEGMAVEWPDLDLN